jgi:glutamate--cysteine ligase catalytic subunit
MHFFLHHIIPTFLKRPHGLPHTVVHPSQVTFQASSIAQARHLYDHLGVLAPIMLALTAATPVLKGMLCDTDVRWSTIAQSVDDRTIYESGEKDIGDIEMGAGPSASGFYAGSKDSAELELMAGRGRKSLVKSRYDSISTFICNCKGGQEEGSKTDKYNDVDCPVDDETYQKLKEGGIDDKLARHIGHLFVRDPLVIYREKLYLDNQNDNGAPIISHWICVLSFSRLSAQKMNLLLSPLIRSL